MRKRKTQALVPAQPTTPPQLLSIPEVARSLSIGRTKVYSLIREEGLPSVKVGRMMRVSVLDLNRWIHEHTQGASQEDMQEQQTGQASRKRTQRAS